MSARLACLAFLLTVPACGGHASSDGGTPPGGLTVTGMIAAMNPSGTSHMSYATATSLVDDRGTLPNDVDGGRCIITHSDGGSDRIDVAVERTGTMLDAGIHQFEVRLDDTRPGHVMGVVTASLGPPDPSGASTYVGGPDSSCPVTVTFSAASATAMLTVPSSCTLVSASGSVLLAGTLSFAGCSVE